MTGFSRSENDEEVRDALDLACSVAGICLCVGGVSGRWTAVRSRLVPDAGSPPSPRPTGYSGRFGRRSMC